MSAKQTYKPSSAEAPNRPRVLNEASELLLGTSKNGSQSNPSQRATEALKLLESLRHNKSSPPERRHT